MHPARSDVAWDDIDGRVVLAFPRKRHPIERLLGHILPTPDNALMTLEGPAAAFWRAADGTRTLSDIAHIMNEHDGTPGDGANTAEAFARRLFVRGLVTLHERPTPAPDTRRGLTPENGFTRHLCRCGATIPIRGPPRAVFFCPRCRRPQRLPPPGTGAPRGPTRTNE